MMPASGGSLLTNEENVRLIYLYKCQFRIEDASERHCDGGHFARQMHVRKFIVVQVWYRRKFQNMPEFSEGRAVFKRQMRDLNEAGIVYGASRRVEICKRLTPHKQSHYNKDLLIKTN